jgi:hypothetical protein
VHAVRRRRAADLTLYRKDLIDNWVREGRRGKINTRMP